MRLWLLDADVIIKFLEIDIFENLAELHKLHIASSVIGEVKFYYRNNKKIPIDFRNEYIDTGLVVESTASITEIQNILSLLPPSKLETIHIGELESLAILIREETLIFCTFDAAAIRALPFLNVTDRGISAEKLLKESGLALSSGHKIDAKLSDAYFKSNLDEGKKDFIYSVGKR